MHWSKFMPTNTPKQPQLDLLKHFAKDSPEEKLEALRILTAPQRVGAWAALVGSVSLIVVAAFKYFH